jgi:hypothetical protein
MSRRPFYIFVATVLRGVDPTLAALATLRSKWTVFSVAAAAAAELAAVPMGFLAEMTMGFVSEVVAGVVVFFVEEEAECCAPASLSLPAA